MELARSSLGFLTLILTSQASRVRSTLLRHCRRCQVPLAALKRSGVGDVQHSIREGPLRGSSWSSLRGLQSVHFSITASRASYIRGLARRLLGLDGKCLAGECPDNFLCSTSLLDFSKVVQCYTHFTLAMCKKYRSPLRLPADCIPRIKL